MLAVVALCTYAVLPHVCDCVCQVVSVKEMKETQANPEEISTLKTEAANLTMLGHHPCVTRLFGQYCEYAQLYEYGHRYMSRAPAVLA